MLFRFLFSQAFRGSSPEGSRPLRARDPGPSRRELVFVGALLFVLVLVLGGIVLGRKDAAPDPRTTGETLSDQPARSIAPGEEDEQDFETQGGAAQGSPDPGEGVSADLRLALASKLQEVEDGTPDLFGSAFDLLVTYVQRVSWKEVNQSADPILAEEIHSGERVDRMTAERAMTYRDRWAKARGRFVEIEGEVRKIEPLELPAEVEGVGKLYRVLVTRKNQIFVVLTVLPNAEPKETLIVKGAFFKILRVAFAEGLEGDFPVLVAKAFGSGTGAESIEGLAEERILAAVRDLSDWKGPGLYYLLAKFATIPHQEIAERVSPDVLQMVTLRERAPGKPLEGEALHEAIEEKRDVWRAKRGGVDSFTGTLKSLKERALPEGAAPGLAKVYTGLISEEESKRQVGFVVAEAPEYEVGARVTIRGAFYMMARYTARESERTYYHPLLVGRALTSGAVHPVFTLEQRPQYLANVDDLTKDVPESDSYYYLLWWLEKHADAAAIRAEATDERASQLYPGRALRGKELEERYKARWAENRGSPIRIVGRLITANEEELPEDRVPADMSHKKVWSGQLYSHDYRILSFTTLDRGEGVYPDEGAEVRGIFFKYWKYENRKGGTTESLYVLGPSLEKVADERSGNWMSPWAYAVGGVVLLCVVLLAVGFVQERRMNRVPLRGLFRRGAGRTAKSPDQLPPPPPAPPPGSP